MPILTARLELIPATLDLLRADLRGREPLAEVLGVPVPETWPTELYDEPAIEWAIAQLLAHPENAEWLFYYFLRRPEGSAPAALIGAGGFKGSPRNGTVELGYSILAEERRKRYATEATLGMLARAFERPDVHRVIAHTLPGLAPSIGVLETCGFRFVGEGEEEGTILYERKRD